MKTTLNSDVMQEIGGRLADANAAFAAKFPGESDRRQPVHTVYGGAQIFRADTAQKLGTAALAALAGYAPTPRDLARAFSLPGTPARHKTLYDRIVSKIRTEAVEDFRIDFEDGYGNRPDAEEDGHAESVAGEVARGLREGSLPPFLGIRIKPFTEELKARSIRTLDIFLSSLLEQTGSTLPSNFVITIPKVNVPEQVSALVRAFEAFEERFSLPARTLRLEIMVETPQSIMSPSGECAIHSLVAPAAGRCVAAHFGVYDYTASMNITAAYQSMDNPACDFARHMMKVALAGTGIWISDGATNVMPVGPHRPRAGGKLTPAQRKENAVVVHRAWKLAFDHTTHSLVSGYYQGWDLHPAQFPARYAAVYSFFREGLDAASYRLRTFVEKAAQATLVGDVFDDAATGQGLLNFFLRGINCGAITEEESGETGLSVAELRTRSFLAILNARRKKTG